MKELDMDKMIEYLEEAAVVESEWVIVLCFEPILW